MNQRSCPFILSRSARGCIWVALAAVVCISLMALLGWALDLRWLKAFGPYFIPMRIMAAICFLTSVASLALSLGAPASGWKPVLSRIFAIVTLSVGSVTMVGYLIDATAGATALPHGNPFLDRFVNPPDRLAFLTAINFTLFGFVLLLAPATRRLAGIAHALLLPVSVISYSVIVGYLLDVPALYAWPESGVALNTGIALCALCLAAFLARPDTWLMQVFVGDEAGAIMARRLLPALLSIPLIIGWLRLYGERWGLFTSEVGVAGVALANTLCLLWLVWLSARSVNRTDRHRRLAEHSVRESEQRLRTILDALPVAIFLSDPKGNVIFTNPAVDRIWGHSPHVSRDRYGEYTGRWLESGKPVEPEQWALARTLETGKAFINDLVELETSSGRTIIYNFALPIRNDQDELLGVVVVSEDVTERMQSQEQLRLAKEAAERTAEELQRSNRDLEQFAYVSSHDLQEPLRMVAGFMQLFAERYQGKMDATAERYIHFAVDGAKRMQQLIEDLLAYSRAGSQRKELQPADAGRLVSQSIHNLELSIKESHAQIECEKLPTVNADGPQLVQVFQNLISNAIKFHGEKAPHIQIGAREDGDCWVFWVKDNGIGIDPEYFDKIFMIFQRLHTRERYAGTGIGLAICKKIVDRHGGRIWVESAEGQGSTFYFTLPT